jgi:nucleoside-diphosphate-sugar epimerase
MKILVTGGAGYIGSMLVPDLLARGHEVTVLDNLLFGQHTLLECCASDKFTLARGDARDEGLLARLLKGQDAVIPLAALVGMPISQRDPVAAQTTNQGAVELLCKLADNKQKIILPTTNSGYGIGKKDEMCTEDSPLKPLSLYGRTKMAAEAAVLARANGVSFRLATVFGCSPRMRLDLLVNDFVWRAVHDRAVVVFEGHFRRNFIHVRDVVRLFSHALENFDAMKGKAYNAGLDSANLSKLQLCAEIKKEVPGFVYMEAPIGEDPDKRDYVVSNARLKKAGFEAKVTLGQGIKELVKGCAILQRSIHGNA